MILGRWLPANNGPRIRLRSSRALSVGACVGTTLGSPREPGQLPACTLSKTSDAPARERHRPSCSAASVAGWTESGGALTKKLEELGVADNTIVIVVSDNGAMKFSWPDGATSPFQGEKATTWEAGVRVPAIVKWPGVVKPGTVFNDISGHNDWVPTLMAAAGEPGIKEKLLEGHEAGGKTYKVHLDGYDQTALLKGEGPGARKEFHYVTDDGDYAAFRYGPWKISFLTQACDGFDVWDCEYVAHRAPRITNLRQDPFEDAVQPGGASWNYDEWMFRRAYLFVPAQGFVGAFVKSFKEFPPRGLPASFSVGDALKKISENTHN